MSTTALLILCLLFIKHFFAEFPLQTPKYFERKAAPTGWVGPMLVHCGIHALLTAVILIPFIGLSFWIPMFIDFFAHLTIDVWKARLVKYTPKEKRFWVALGLDQLLHAITYLQIAYLVTV